MSDRKNLRSKKPLVFFANGIGDSILALPALRALCEIYYNKVTFICADSPTAGWFSDLPVYKLIKVKMSRDSSGRIFDWRSVRCDIESCNLFISLVPWISNSIIEILDNFSFDESIGFFPDFSIKLFLDYSKHTSELNFDVVSYINPDLRYSDYTNPPLIGNSEANFVSGIKKNLGKHKLLAVHAETENKKCWDTKNFNSVLNDFLVQKPHYMVFQIGRNGPNFDLGIRSNHLIPCFSLGLETSCAIVANADLFLGIDSCMLHVADFYRVPTIGLFGPTDPTEFGCRFTKHLHIRGKNNQMSSITTKNVLSALISMA